MKTPFWNSLGEIVQNKTRFFVPGHKGNPAAIPPFGDFLRYDLTEVDGADDLSRPSGALVQSQNNMAKIYGSGATLYSASGSTSCIEAMLTLFLQPKDKIVMLRGCHVSAVRALAFVDIEPVWLLQKNGIACPQDIESALQKSRAKAVYITSPAYDGRMSDIRAISEICQRYSAILLVDNAHGAHLRFLPTDNHPISLGADACADSAHKTLPCLTPAAMLHIKNPALATKARIALNLYSSTSPSYLVMQSLDLAAGLLAEGLPDFAHTAHLLAQVTLGSEHLLQKSDDPLKLCIKPASGGYRSQEIAGALAMAGILPELADSQKIVLMASPYNTQSNFDLLEKVLLQFPKRAPHIAPFVPEFYLPQSVCSVRNAVFAPSEEVSPERALGRIAAETSAPCPPGVPVIIPGELLTENTITFLQYSGIEKINVVI